jgi:hypothetical protein
MNTNLGRDIQRACESFERDHDRLRAELMASLPAEAPEAPRLHKAVRRRLWIGTSPMTRRILLISLPAAAAAAVLLGVGLWPESGHKGHPSGSGRVYALSDIPGLIHSAKVLHLHEWYLFPRGDVPPGVQRRRINIDNWLDVTTGRWCRTCTDGGLVDGSPPPEELRNHRMHYSLYVCDGTYTMELGYNAPLFEDDPSVKKTAEFTRMTPFMRNLTLRRYYPELTKVAFYDNPSVLAYSKKVGQETIDGVAFDIWEHEWDGPHDGRTPRTNGCNGTHRFKTRVWLSPASGVVARGEVWVKSAETDGVWLNTDVTDKIERDIVPPPGTFDTVPPPEYTLKNTKETAPLASISDDCNVFGFGDLEIRCHIFFPLNDGTILFGWSSRDEKSDESQAPLFANLEVGGALPKLPIEVQAFVPENTNCDLVYTGFHLTWTQKDGRFYEWSLFVPNKELTSPQDRCAKMFDFRYEVHSDNPTAAKREPIKHTVAGFPFYEVKNAAEFDELVSGAMGDLSDGDVAPEGITYEYVMQLSRQIRESLAKP